MCEIKGDKCMPGTVNGGRKAAKTNKNRHGKDFYARIGKIGGEKGHTGGFAANRELARAAGRKGGLISRRSKAVKKSDQALAA
jgi:uncharacterized protein